MKALAKFGAILGVLFVMAVLCLVGVMSFVNAIISIGRGDFFMTIICAIAWVWLAKPMKNCIDTLVMIWDKKL